MGMKAITIYTPATAEPHIYAEDDAQVHRALIGSSGITLADSKLACSVLNANTVRIASGLYSMQGYLLSVVSGTYQDLTVDSGSAGAYRHDLVIADFVRGSGSTADAFTFQILKGTNATSEAGAADPTIIQEDLTGETVSGVHRQEVLYRLLISGTDTPVVERVAPYIGNVYQ